MDLGAESLSRILTTEHTEHTETNFRDAAFPGRSHLSPDGGGLTRAAPLLGSGWLRFGSRRFAIPGRSHLSPDGGGPYSPRFHRLAADGYDSTADDSPSPDVATCRQTVEALLATHHRLAADGYDSKADDSRSPAVATCRQTAEALLAPLSTDWQRMATGNDPKEKGLLLPTPLSR